MAVAHLEIVPARDVYAEKIAAFHEKWPMSMRGACVIGDAELVAAIAQANDEYEQWLAYIVRDLWRELGKHPASGQGAPASEISAVLATGATWHTWNTRYFAALGIPDLSVIKPWPLNEYVRDGMPDTHGHAWELQPKTVGALVRARNRGLVHKPGDWKLTDRGEALLHEASCEKAPDGRRWL